MEGGDREKKGIFSIMNYQGKANEKAKWAPPLLVGLQAGTTTLEISLEVPQKTGHSTTGGPSYTTPGHISRRCANM